MPTTIVKPGFQLDAQGAFITKDPQARKDYTIDISRFLKNGDTIDAVVWEVEPGINVHNQGRTATTVFIELSGGTLGRAYVCTARFTTVQGITDDQSFRCVIRAN